jgi:hypothetical protein
MSFESICFTGNNGCKTCCVMRDGIIRSLDGDGTVRSVSGKDFEVTQLRRQS